MSRISIIMPSLNVADYITQCLESVTSQSLRDIEVICIDAGSTDGTLEIIKDYAYKDSRIRVIQSDVRSYGRQMNVGIDEATGDYIGIVETDDYIEPKMFEILLSGAMATDADVVKAEYFYTYDVDGQTYNEARKYVPQYIRFAPFSPKQEPNIHKWDSYIWNGIYKRSFLLENNIRFLESKGAAYQDIGFKHRVLNYARKVLYYKQPLYHYRVARQGSSSTTDNGLQYAFNEYKALIDGGEIKDSFLLSVTASMTLSMMRELRKLVRHEEKTFYKSWHTPIKWLKGGVNPLYDQMMFSRALISDEEKEEIEVFIKKTDNYMDKMRKNYKHLLSWSERLKVNVADRPLVLAGLSQGTNYLRDFFMRNEISLVAVTDDDKVTWGSDFGAFKVMRPEEVASAYDKAVYFVPDNDRSNELVEELVECGIEDCSILIAPSDVDLVTLAKLFPEL